ncbi:MAG: hypothetical protein FWE19_02485 [Oscillospiraceae bacterium]|nr:hypothetical protein [Oscillospiraceae bacterium]
MEKDMLSIRPVEKYEAPEIPTLRDTRSNPALLKKLPSRWKKNAAVITCIGLMGSSVLSGCVEPSVGNLGTDSNNGQDEYSSDNGGEGGYNGGYALDKENGTEENLSYSGGEYNGYSEFDLSIRIHGGGAGFAAYVVHLTEQEAVGIIRAQLEAAGLRLNDAPPEYTALEEWWGPAIGIDLFDARRNVAITHLDWQQSHQPFMRGGRDFADMVAEDFVEQTDISVGVFYTSGFFPEGWAVRRHWFETDDGQWDYEELSRPTDEEIARAKAEARPILEERLTAQIQEFVAFLQAEGVI